jgi:hypothetical protein
MPHDRLPAEHACTIALALALAALPACAQDESITRFKDAHVLYDGQPYGDLIVLADEVRSCMHSDKTDLPRVTLVDQIFECYTTVGWRQVLGCTGDDRVFLVAPVAEQTEGQLWSHELTHYYGSDTEDDPCAVLALPGFTLECADAGRCASRQ